MGFENWQGENRKCEKCGRVYAVREHKYPARDDAHDVKCECGAVLVYVPSGTWDCSIEKLVSGPTENSEG